MAFYLGENKIAGMWVKDTTQNIIDILPYGLQSFQIYDGGAIEYKDTPNSYRLGKNNFTVVKYFSSRVSGVSNKFFKLYNNSGDSFFVGCEGYTFKVEIKIANTTIFLYSVNSSQVYSVDISNLFCCEIDYDKLEIRITSDNFSTIISVPELTQVKGIDFTNTVLYVNQYLGQCPYVFAVNQLINYNIVNILVNSDKTFPTQKFKNSGDGSIIKIPPTKWGRYNISWSFVDGVINLTSSDFAGFSTSNNYLYAHFEPITESLPKYDDAYQYRFSMDVENGEFTFNKTTAAGLTKFRLINKDTGVVNDYIGSSNISTITIPSGRYIVEYFALTYYRYGTMRINYPVGFGGITDGTIIKIYNDWDIRPVSIMTSSIARLANYNFVLCPFSKQVGTGTYGLSDVFI